MPKKKQCLWFNCWIVKNSVAFLEKKVPKSWFTLYYLFGSFLNAVLLFSLFYFRGEDGARANSQICLQSELLLFRVVEAVLLELHLLRRLLECLFVSIFSRSSMAVAVLGGGLAFYFLVVLGASVDIVCSCSFATGTTVNRVKNNQYLLLWGCGIIIFLVSSMNQLECHRILGSIRTSLKVGRSGDPDQTAQYAIPEGNLFKFVSCPHYFWEVCIYMSFFLMKQSSSSALTLIWVSQNLAVTAAKTHGWYEKKFDDYPLRKRHKMVPFIY